VAPEVRSVRRRLRQELRDFRDGARIIASREFWRAFAAYWHPAALAARMDEWAWNYRERTGQKPDWKLWRRIAERRQAERQR
jgi:hypothetical protein